MLDANLDQLTEWVAASEGKVAEQDGIPEHYGFRKGHPGYDKLRHIYISTGGDEKQMKKVLKDLLRARAIAAGADRLTDPGAQGAMLSIAHMRGEGGARAIFASIARGADPEYSLPRLENSDYVALNSLRPDQLQDRIRVAREAYDRRWYWSKPASTGNRKGKWGELFGRGLLDRYDRERRQFLAMAPVTTQAQPQPAQPAAVSAITEKRESGEGWMPGVPHQISKHIYASMKPSFVVIHRVFGGPFSAEGFRQDVRYNQENDRGVSYHFLVGPNGEIAQSVPIFRQGAHARGVNGSAIGIGLTGRGNYDPSKGRMRPESGYDPVTPSQMESLARILQWIKGAADIQFSLPPAWPKQNERVTSWSGLAGHLNVISDKGKEDTLSPDEWRRLLALLEERIT